jgi:hypothetical protein
LRQQSIPIEVDGMFQLLFLYPLDQTGTEPQLGALYSALRILFGETGTLYDGYKGSFSFPFLLYIQRGTGRFRYLLEICDWKGGLEFRLWKVVDRPDELGAGLERHVYRKPRPEEFSREECHHYLAHLYGFLQGFIETYLPQIGGEPFLKQIPAKLTLYGYCGGEFFEQEYELETECQKAREEFTKRIAGEDKVAEAA